MFKMPLSRRAAAGSQYALVVGLIGVVALLAVTAAGSGVRTQMGSVANRLGAADNGTAGSGGSGGSGGGGGPAPTTGQVYGWGNNGNYGLTGSVGQPAAPALLAPFNSIGAMRLIATDGNTTCSISNSNGYYCVGLNNYSQAQPGGPSAIQTPYSLGTVAADQLSGNNTASCRRVGSTVSCFGDSGSSGCSGPFGATATALAGGVTDFKMGSFFGCAVLSSGAVICWGTGGNGMGAATGCNGSYNTMIASGASRIGTGIGNHSCALMTDGSVRCWGLNDYLQLGAGTTGTGPFTTAQTVTDVSGASLIAAGSSHSCAVVGGVARCWGRNTHGQLGDGTTTSRANSVAVSGPTGISHIGLGFLHSCVLTGAGRVWCWGDNSNGQVGNGVGSGTVLSPHQINTLSSVIQLSVGQHSVVAVAP